MSSPSPDAVKVEIDQGRMKVGNEILKAVGTVIGGLYQLAADSAGKLVEITSSVGSLIHAQQSSTTGTATPLVVEQQAITLPALKITGRSAADVLVNTLVAGASVTTATKAGFVRVAIVDSAGVMTDGSYYLEVFTIT